MAMSGRGNAKPRTAQLPAPQTANRMNKRSPPAMTPNASRMRKTMTPSTSPAMPPKKKPSSRFQTLSGSFEFIDASLMLNNLGQQLNCSVFLLLCCHGRTVNEACPDGLWPMLERGPCSPGLKGRWRLASHGVAGTARQFNHVPDGTADLRIFLRSSGTPDPT